MVPWHLVLLQHIICQETISTYWVLLGAARKFSCKNSGVKLIVFDCQHSIIHFVPKSPTYEGGSSFFGQTLPSIAKFLRSLMALTSSFARARADSQSSSWRRLSSSSRDTWPLRSCGHWQFFLKKMLLGTVTCQHAGLFCSSEKWSSLTKKTIFVYLDRFPELRVLLCRLWVLVM